MRKSPSKKAKFISLTSHPGRSGTASLPIHWGEGSARQRGPVIGSLSNPAHRNVIGSHSGSYAIYRALAVATGALDPERVADLTDTSPTSQIGPHEAWRDPTKIVSIDAFGAVVGNAFSDLIAQGYDIRPTIAITRANAAEDEWSSILSTGGAHDAYREKHETVEAAKAIDEPKPEEQKSNESDTEAKHS